MIRLTGNLKLLAYSDESVTNNPRQRLFDFDKIISESGLTEFQTKNLVVEDGTTDLEIGLDGVEPEHLFINSDQQIEVKLNGSVTAITLNGVFYLQGSVDEIVISNSSGEDANVVIAFGV